jgi:internalin A
MERNDTYRIAEEKIEAARRSGAKTLDLGNSVFSSYTQRLTELPPSLTTLTKLQRLDLSRNRLTELPPRLSQLSQLQWLDLSGNQLTSLPDSLGWLTKLESLNLNHNQLTALPGSLDQLTRLKMLTLFDNRLSAIPKAVLKLVNLEGLYVPGNQIRTLPDELGRLTKLTLLSLGGNQITKLPATVGDLQSLKHLYLGLQSEGLGNPLIELPEEITRLTKLEALDVSNCPELRLPPEIVAKRDAPREILDYYFATRGDQGKALRELKLVVVGRGQVGKTSLVKRLNRQSLDPLESETHGINIRPLNLACHDGPVTARVWDFGGQHVLHAMHEFFLTARSLYLLVLGERDDMAERDAAYWLQLIRSYAETAPVVVALNKSGGRAREMDRESLERNFGPILAWIPTECSPGFDDTIENLRRAITKAADGMEEVRHPFPRKWWEIKKSLENMGEPYLDFTSYQERCRRFNEEDPQQQEKLAAWLNDLGIAINYGDDPRLHDTTVLRPEWLANGIYAVLRANDSHHENPLAPDAMLSADSLGTIYAGAEKLGMLKAADYPPEKWPFLVQLMKLFQLAFPIDDRGDRLLVTTLLPLEPPQDCDEPNESDRTRLRYEFAVVPGPLLPKLLVRTFSLIEGRRRWRRGAMLRFAKARARVWTTQDERWVHITAVGNAEDRDELLTMLRVTLQELIAEYRNLQAVEQWEHNGKWVPRETLEEFGVLPVETKVAK